MDGPFVMRWKAGVGLLLLPVIACGAENPWSGTVGGTTDYIYRGISQTYESPALQLGANYQSPIGWFAGIWGSNVKPYPHVGASAELDLYTGVTQPLGADFSTRLVYTHYTYLSDPRPAHYDYDEFSLTAAYLDRLAATVSYQPDSSLYSTRGFVRHRPMGALELTGRWPLRGELGVFAGAGYYDLQRLFGISYWAGDVGLSYVHKRVTIEVTRFFAEGTVDRLFDAQSADGDWTLSASLRF